MIFSELYSAYYNAVAEVLTSVMDGTVTENISAIEQFILISTETRGYRKENHRPVEEAYAAAKAGDTFLVDYVRDFDVKE